MVIYLYKKTHLDTGLQYLGKTSSIDPYKYKGSGTHWLRHIKKYGYNVETHVLRECQSNEEVKFWGLHFSKLWNIIDERDERGKKTWANLKAESGDGGAVYGESNGMFGKTHSDDSIQRMREGKTGQPSWNKGIPCSTEVKQAVSRANTGKLPWNKGIPRTAEEKALMSENRKGQPAHNKGRKEQPIMCEHCNKEISGKGNFVRWHGDNCKSKL